MILTEEIIQTLPMLTEEEEKKLTSYDDFVKYVVEGVERDLEDLDENGRVKTIIGSDYISLEEARRLLHDMVDKEYARE